MRHFTTTAVRNGLLGIALPAVMAGAMTAHEAGYLDAVADYGADNSGASVTTTHLQAAIDAAANQKKALFLPAGAYLIDNTLIAKNKGDEREDPVIIVGSSIDPDSRSLILLKTGSFTDPANPKPMIHSHGWSGYDTGYPDTFNRLLHSVDFAIEPDNAGAIGVNWRGAEGCSMFDVHIDVTGGYAGMGALPGSGGSIAKLRITGGQYGITISDGCQPTPTLTDVTFEGQSRAAIHSVSTRGALTITGGLFDMSTGVPAFDCTRHSGFTWSPGGNPVLTDCVIQYPSADAGNVVMVMTDGRDQSVFFMDVYVRNAAQLLDEDATVACNPNGWRHYAKFAYNAGWDRADNGDEPVYLDGVMHAGLVYEDYTDDREPPADIQGRHSWGETFPSFETPGAVNVEDYAAQVDNGDWAPAFNAAIAAADANGSNVVFVPDGDYVIFNTIELKPQTALIGCSHYNSVILGQDDAGRRFGGSTHSWTDPKPMVRTPDDRTATCMLADIGVRPYGPYDGIGHSPEALACYAILWRAGNNSVIRNINYMWLSRDTYYRAAFVLDRSLNKSQWLSLQSIASPATIDGMVFASDCAHAYHTMSSPVASRILTETVDGNKRIMTRSMPPPRFNAANDIAYPNLTITKSGGGSFDIASLKIAHSSWDPAEGADMTITADGGSGATRTVSLQGTARESLQTVHLNWTGVSTVELASRVPFSIDDVSIDGAVSDFENVSGTDLEVGTDIHHWCSGYGYYHLPMFVMAHAYVTIEGGCKWYNHWKHGSTWMRITEPYVMVRDNDPTDIVSIYHFHAQHSQNFYKLKVVNAHNVSFFGAKTENCLEFAHAENSDNIRFFGHGGMTNPPVGAAHYRLEDCTNWAVVSPSNEVYNNSGCPWCGMGDAMLPRTEFGTFDVVQDVNSGAVTVPNQTHIPILYMRSEPTDPWSADLAVFPGRHTAAATSGPPTPRVLMRNDELLRIGADNAAPYTVRIIDCRGRMVGTTLARGRHVVRFGELPQGVYVVTIMQGAQRNVRRVSVLKR